MQDKQNSLVLTDLGINTLNEPVIYMRRDCPVCLSEGFEAHARLLVSIGGQSIIATLNTIRSDLLGPGEVGLSDYAFNLLGGCVGDSITVSHAQPLKSLSYLREKIFTGTLSASKIKSIITDITHGRYSDIHISSFLTTCAGGRMQKQEIVSLTQAMVETGDRLIWDQDMVVDKHCVGGLPGNRTSPIVVPIVAAFGLTMPKTSSRAITSPAGTADTMEVLAPVELGIAKMKAVVEQENGCIAWGGAARLSPSDEIMIRVEKALDLDSEGQLVASILSKKIAAGSTHVVFDIPIGPTAKVRSQEMAELLKSYLQSIGTSLGIVVKAIFTDGTQPIGRGIGPALEARDVLTVLQGHFEAPADLRQRSLELAGHIIEFSPDVSPGNGLAIATQILESGQAWEKFQAICAAQGGLREIPQAPHTHPLTAQYDGIVSVIDNRRLALAAKLAGAPADKDAGVALDVRVGTRVLQGDLLFTLHAHTPGELKYALDYLQEGNACILIERD